MDHAGFIILIEVLVFTDSLIVGLSLSTSDMGRGDLSFGEKFSHLILHGSMVYWLDGSRSVESYHWHVIFSSRHDSWGLNHHVEMIIFYLRDLKITTDGMVFYYFSKYWFMLSTYCLICQSTAASRN